MNLNLRIAAGQTAVMAVAGLASAAVLQMFPIEDAREGVRPFLIEAVMYPAYAYGTVLLLKWRWWRTLGARKLPAPDADEAQILSTRILVCVALTLVTAAVVALVPLGPILRTVRMTPILFGVLAATGLTNRLTREAAGAQA